MSNDNNNNNNTTHQPQSLPPKALRLEFYKRIEATVQQKIDFLTTELQDRRPIPSRLFNPNVVVVPIQCTQPRKRQIDYYKTALLPAISAALLLPLPHNDESLYDCNADDDKNNTDQNDDATTTTTTTMKQKNHDNTTATTTTRTRTTTNASTQSPLPLSLQDVYAVLSLTMGNLLLVSHKNYDARCRHVLKTAAVQWMVESIIMTTQKQCCCEEQKQQEMLGGEHNNNNSMKESHGANEKETDESDDTSRHDDSIDKKDETNEGRSSAGTISSSTTTSAQHSNHPRTIFFLTECTDDDDDDDHDKKKKKKKDGDQQRSKQEKQDKSSSASNHDDDENKKKKKESSSALDSSSIKSSSHAHNKSSIDEKDKNKDYNDEETAREDSSSSSSSSSGGKKVNEQGEQGKASAKQQEETESSQQPQQKPQQHITSKQSSKKKTYKCTTTLFELDTTDQAVRQFEAMEKSIAVDILKVLVERNARENQQQQQQLVEATLQQQVEAQKQRRHRRMELLKKSLQITAAGVLVGSLFAVTGGLAAPGLVAAIAALGINSSAAAFAALTTTHALASMFGVLGGGLGVYKMSKRVQGLSEWRIRQETTTVVQQQQEESSSSLSSSGGGSSSATTNRSSTDSTAAASENDGSGNKDNTKQENESDKVNLHGLHAHVCVSGWLADKSDFQRPFGVQPNDPPSPPLDDLQRFFCVYAPERIRAAKVLLEERKDDMAAFGRELREQYGRDPGTLLPLQRTQQERILSADNERTIYSMLDEYVLAEARAEKMKQIYEANTMLMEMEARNEELMASVSVSPVEFSERKCSGDEDLSEALDGSLSNDEDDASPNEETTSVLSAKLAEGAEMSAMDGHDQRTVDLLKKQPKSKEQTNDEPKPVVKEGNDLLTDEDKDIKMSEEVEQEPAKKDEAAAVHSQVIWDWQARYSGELYTVTWETDFLLNLCKVATVLFREIGDQISKQILTTALVGAAIAVPSALHTASSVIDDPYQIISLRSEKAGIELAHCLLEAEEHRPISLVGFSFGARVCFACLRELARHQLLWLEKQKLKEEAPAELPKKGFFAKMRRKNSKIAPEDDINYKREPASIVEDVVLIGMPRLISSREWINVREIVAGRIVNCYNPSDWIVSYMINIRCWNGVRKTCGTHPIVKHISYGQPRRPCLSTTTM